MQKRRSEPVSAPEPSFFDIISHMKTFPLLIAALACGSYCLADDAQFTLTATARTRDGSVIKGTMLTESFSGATLFCEKLALAPEQIKSLTFTKPDGETKAVLSNGDTFSYTLANANVVLNSSLGSLTIPCNSLQSLVFEKRRVTNLKDALIFSCDFESKEEIPGFRGGSLVPGKVGQALHVPAHTSAASVELPMDALGTEGTIEFWGKIDEDAYMEDCGCPRFFAVINDRQHGIAQDWNANNGRGRCGLTFRVGGLPEMASSDFGMSSYASVLGDVTGWHHYAVVWNGNGLDVKAPYPMRRLYGGTLKDHALAMERDGDRKIKAAVFVDGRCIMSSSSETWDGSVFNGLAPTLYFPSIDFSMPDYGRVGYTIDQFRIWKIAKLEFDK